MATEFDSFKVILSDETGHVLPLDDKFPASDEQVQYFRGVKLRQYVNAAGSRFRISLSIKQSFIFEGFDTILISVFLDAGFEKCFVVDKTVLTAQTNDWTGSVELSAEGNSAASQLDIAFWKFRYEGGSIPISQQPDLPLSPFKHTHLVITVRTAGQIREWHLQRVDARPMATFTYICHLKNAHTDERVEEPNCHARTDTSQSALQISGSAVAPSDVCRGQVMSDRASDVEDVLQVRSRMVYLCSICSKWRTSNNRISHYQHTHGLPSAPLPTEPTRTLNDEEIAGARKTPAFRCIVCGLWRAHQHRERHYRTHLMPTPPVEMEQSANAISLLRRRTAGIQQDQIQQRDCLTGTRTNRTFRPDAVTEAAGQSLSERPTCPTQVAPQVSTQTIKEEVPPDIDHFHQELECSAVQTVKHEVDNYSIQQDELQRQDNILRAISHVKRCMSPMRPTDTQDALAKKHERFAAISGVKRQISAYFQEIECKRSRNSGQLLIEPSDDSDN